MFSSCTPLVDLSLAAACLSSGTFYLISSPKAVVCVFSQEGHERHKAIAMARAGEC